MVKWCCCNICEERLSSFCVLELWCCRCWSFTRHLASRLVDSRPLVLRQLASVSVNGSLLSIVFIACRRPLRHGYFTSSFSVSAQVCFGNLASSLIIVSVACLSVDWKRTFSLYQLKPGSLCSVTLLFNEKLSTFVADVKKDGESGVDGNFLTSIYTEWFI